MPDMRIGVRVINSGCDEVFHKRGRSLEQRDVKVFKVALGAVSVGQAGLAIESLKSKTT
jgi:hypothetical protein